MRRTACKLTLVILFLFVQKSQHLAKNGFENDEVH